jgi:membrane-associated phospholipid phosphatase
MMKKIFIFALSLSCLPVFGNTLQEKNIEHTDSLAKKDIAIEKNSFSAAKFIIPTTFIIYGVVTRLSEFLQNFDHNIHGEIKNSVSRKYTFDNYLQYASPVAMYALNLSGVKSEHNLRDQTIIFVNAALLTEISVQTVKHTTKVARPNSTSKTAFPSGHTATAFVGAHILYKEYKDVSTWIGFGGYLSAATVGVFRMINQRHWFSDVVTGAGFGILCAEISYLMLPFYHCLFGINDDGKGVNSMLITPLVGADFYGAGLTLRF